MQKAMNEEGRQRTLTVQSAGCAPAIGGFAGSCCHLINNLVENKSESSACAVGYYRKS